MQRDLNALRFQIVTQGLFKAYELVAEDEAISPPSDLSSTNLVLGGAPTELCDIVYLLQCVVPGLVTINCVDTGTGIKLRRVLPSEDWIQAQERYVRSVFQEEGEYENLLEAARDVHRTIRVDFLPDD